MTAIRIGGADLTMLRDGTDRLPRAVFSRPHGHALREGPKDSTVEIPINAFLYRTKGRCVLIDAGGAGLAPGLGHVAQLLDQHGITADQIDTVVCTHLHPDHIGGLLRGGKPVFAKAKLMLHQDERDFWSNLAPRDGAPAPFAAVIDGAQAVLAAYAANIHSFTDGTEIAPGMAAVHLPGHTPGHSGMQFGAPGSDLLMFADIVHSAAVQLPHPDTSIVFDTDAQLAAKTRHRILNHLADSGTGVAGCHLDGFGRIERDGIGFAFRLSP